MPMRSEVKDLKTKHFSTALFPLPVLVIAAQFYCESHVDVSRVGFAAVAFLFLDIVKSG